MSRRTPYMTIADKAASEGTVPPGLVPLLPSKWEFLGDILSIRLAPPLEPYRAGVAALYAGVLNVKTVVQDTGGIGGVTRRPKVEVIWGAETETVHTENGVRYRMDVTKVMFSSGNIDERMRAAKLECAGQNVLDMFAGIGYFTLPVAVHASPDRVIACDINPDAVRFLEMNVRANGVEGKVEVRRGDCREVSPQDWADRIFMGYLHETHEFLPAAMAALRHGGGTIHYHEVCPEELMDRRPEERVEGAAESSGYSVTRAELRKVKSYAPGVWHVVVDADLSRG